MLFFFGAGGKQLLFSRVGEFFGSSCAARDFFLDSPFLDKVVVFGVGES